MKKQLKFKKGDKSTTKTVDPYRLTLVNESPCGHAELFGDFNEKMDKLIDSLKALWNSDKVNSSAELVFASYKDKEINKLIDFGNPQEIALYAFTVGSFLQATRSQVLRRFSESLLS